MTRKSILIVVIAVIIAAAVLFVLARQGPGNGRTDADDEGVASAGGVTSPYDLTEVGGELDFDVLEDSTFVSILTTNSEGKPTSYMADAAGGPAQALIQAVRKADKIDTPPSTAAAQDMVATLTFVLPSRLTVTFALDLDEGLIWREGIAWRPEGDLASLIQAATTAPQE